MRRGFETQGLNVSNPHVTENIKMAELPTATIARIAKKNGVSRIGNDATTKLVEIAENYIAGISKKAAALAAHADRKTVSAEDIALAVSGV